MKKIKETLDQTLRRALDREFVREFAKNATVFGELDEEPINIAFSGMTGTGKTAIIREWAEEHSGEVNFVMFASALLRVAEIDGKKIIFSDDAVRQMSKPHTVLFFDDYHLLRKDVEEELNRLLDCREVETVDGTVKLDDVLFVVAAFTTFAA